MKILLITILIICQSTILFSMNDSDSEGESSNNSEDMSCQIIETDGVLSREDVKAYKKKLDSANKQIQEFDQEM
jgi:hypothetical protein